MKKLIVLSILGFVAFNAFCQKSPNSFFLHKKKNYFKDGKAKNNHKVISKLSNGLIYGFHGSLNSNPNINSTTSNALYLTTRYSLTNNCLLSLKLGYDQFQSKTDDFSKSKIALVNLNLLYDLGDVLDFKSVNYNLSTGKSNLQLYVMAGFGVATFWNTNFINTNGTDPFFKNHDDIFNWNIGFSPEYRIGKKFSISLDFTLYYNYYQDRTFNYSILNNNDYVNFYALSFGVNYFY